jgi:hypothetical protein
MEIYVKAFSRGEALNLVTELIEKSIWFECCPYPDDKSVITVKNEEPGRTVLKYHLTEILTIQGLKICRHCGFDNRNRVGRCMGCANIIE